MAIDPALFDKSDSSAYDSLKKLAEAIPGGFISYEVTPDSLKQIFYSDNAAAVIGYQPKEFGALTSHKPEALAAPEDLGLIMDAVQRVRAGEDGPIELELRIKPAKGPLRWFNMRAVVYERKGSSAFLNCVFTDIHDLKEYAANLRQIEREYSEALSHCDKMVYRFTMADRRVYMPPQLANAFGVPSVCGNVPYDQINAGLVAPESVDDVKEFYDAICRGEKSGVAVTAWRLVRGEVRWYKSIFSTIYDDDKKPISAVITIEDVTERREADISGALDRERLLTALGDIYSFVFSVDLTKNTYTALRNSEELSMLRSPMFGSMEEVLSAAAQRMVHPDDRAGFLRCFARDRLIKAFAEGSRAKKHTFRCRRAGDELWHWMEATALPAHNPYNDDVIDITVARCVDEQMETEQKLRDALDAAGEELAHERFHQRMIDSSVDGATIIYRIEGTKISHMGGRLLDLLGYTKEEFFAFHNNDYVGLVYPADLPRAMEHYKKCASALVPFYEQECRLIKKDGGLVWVLMKSTLVKDYDGAPAYMTVTIDITRQKKLEEELRVTEAETQLAMAQMGKMVCLYDIRKRELTVPPAYAKKHGMSAVTRRIPEALSESGIYDDISLPTVRRFYETIHSGAATGSAEARMHCSDGTLRWERAEFATIFSTEGVPIKAVLAVEDVTDRYEKELAYERLTNRMKQIPQDAMLYYEIDLTAGKVEARRGAISKVMPPVKSYDDLTKNGLERFVWEEDKAELAAFLERGKLLACFAEGRTNGELEYRRMESKEALPLWTKLSLDMVKDPFTGSVRGYFLFTDINAAKTKELAVLRMAERDGMTGLYNKATMERLVRGRLAQGNGKSFAMLIVDIDFLKHINDTYGHAEGDRAIIAVAQTLTERFRRRDLIGRIGGDEFLVFLEDAGTVENVSALLKSLLASAKERSESSAEAAHLSFSVGAALGTSEDSSYMGLFQKADAALYTVKGKGKNGFAIYPDKND